MGRFGLFGGSTRNLCGSGKISKANKKKRAQKRSKVANGETGKELTCSVELLSLSSAGAFKEELRKMNTSQLKQICLENGIARSGAKYEVLASIVAHVVGFRRQQKSVEGEPVIQTN
jgi:hypothetical protein